MSAPIISQEGRRYVVLFGATGLAANSQTTLISAKIPFCYRIVKVKLYYLEYTTPEHRYYVLVGETGAGSVVGLPEGVNIFGEYGQVTYLSSSQGVRILEPMRVVDRVDTYLKVHTHNLSLTLTSDSAAEITIERV